MADAKEGAKKGNKMPVIIAAVLVLAGGGYFMMQKGKPSEPQKQPDVILGEKMDLGEFVTPLKDGKTFLQLQVVVQLGKEEHLGEEGGGGEHSGAAQPDPMARNAVLTVMRDTSPDDIKTSEGLTLLRQRIAWQINHDAEVAESFAPPKEGAKKKKKKKGEAEKFEPVPVKEREYPELDSDDGPVHKVMFTKFLPVDYSN